VYEFELKVTDNNGATGKDTMTVTVNSATPPANLPPAANAGSDQTITLPVNTVTLVGSGIDPDGTITAYQWNKINGPSQFTIVSASQPQTAINNLQQGIYKFELIVTDNAGATGKDTVQITVNSPAGPANQAPIVSAGSDITVTLPVNTVTATGSATDADGTIISYQWTKISGPAQFNIVSSAQAQTVINNLVQGVYEFELRAVDNAGASGVDRVTVTVDPAALPNQAPHANAGAHLNITLPQNSVNLSGSGTDIDGFIQTYKWSKIEGPAAFTIVASSQAQTIVNDLLDGAYKFELEVTDDKGAVGRDTIVVTVHPSLGKVNVYPNPATDRVTVMIETKSIGQKAMIKITDAASMPVVPIDNFTMNQTSQLRTLQIGKLPNGMYFIHIYLDGKHVETKKLVKN
jgi:hypothetical protein